MAFALQAHAEEAVAAGEADPLSCHADEIEATMPEGLQAEGGRAGALRVWTTALALATLERFHLCWSAVDRDGGGSGGSAGGEEGPPRTILDEASEWLHRQAFTLQLAGRKSTAPAEVGCVRFAFGELLTWALTDHDSALEEEAGTSHKSALKLAARRQVRAWAQRAERAVAALRAAERPRPEHYSLLLQRSAGDIARAALTKHETFRRGTNAHAPHKRAPTRLTRPTSAPRSVST